MRGHLRHRAGAWRLTADAGIDPTTGKRRQLHRTVRAPDNRAGRRIAEKALAELVLRADAKRGIVSDTATVAEFLEGYITRRSAAWAPSTRASDIGYLRRHVIGAIGHIHLDDLRRRDIAGLHATLATNGLAAGTVKKIHGILHRALRDAVRLELIPFNPATDMAPTGAEPAPKRAPTDAELDAILAAVDDPQFRTIILVDAVIGSRRGELCALRWSDVDLDDGWIHSTRALSNGGADEGLVERQTKTGAKARKMLDEVTVAELRAHRVRRIEKCLAAGVAMVDDGFVFVPDRDPTGARPLRPDRITAMFSRARRAADVEGVTFHDLRRYVASHLLDAGTDVEAAAAWLGHSAKMLLDVYGAPVNTENRRLAETMARRRAR